MLCVAGLTAVSMQVRCIDAAREAARLAARGDEGDRGAGRARHRATGAQCDLRRDGGFVVATVTADSSLLPGDHDSGGGGGRGGAGVRDDRGSATLVAVAMMAVLLAVTVGGFYVGSAVIARHRAQAAADLAALAAAARLPAGVEAACGQASAMAHAMRVDVAGCAVDELDVVVTVDAGRARAAARAGPADAPS